MRNKRRLAFLLAVAIVCSVLALKVPTLVRAFAGPNEDIARFIDVA